MNTCESGKLHTDMTYRQKRKRLHDFVSKQKEELSISEDNVRHGNHDRGICCAPIQKYCTSYTKNQTTNRNDRKITNTLMRRKLGMC